MNNIVESNIEYLDKVAIEVMKTYVEGQKPTGFKGSMSIARIAYTQALAMLEARENELEKIYERSPVFKLQKLRDAKIDQ